LEAVLVNVAKVEFLEDGNEQAVGVETNRPPEGLGGGSLGGVPAKNSI
jgi:hypothetical protein